MTNEVKLIEELNRAKQRIISLELQLKEMNEAAYYYKNLNKKNVSKIEELEKALLQAVTKLKWGK